MNALLQKDELGRNICIGDIYMAQDTEGRPVLVGGNIKVDYGSLVKNDSVKQKISDFAGKAVQKTMFGGSDVLRKVVEDTAGSVAEIAVGIAPDMAEKKALSVINQKENKGRLLHMAEQVLAERGLCVKLEDFAIVQEAALKMENKAVVSDGQERKLELSPALENELLDAVAGYLKMLTKI